ncbi:FHA domain-containing protein [Microbacterium sp. JZ31]|uniref:FHA domain-containing protein n=1 Tax=Microbacterium sp. JZ31 TaxID=1906274 RepID=UPI001934A657|nr:FHA domain-containing protein [Microbacterium sp. JZ31]
MRVTYEPGGMLTIVADDGVAVLPGGLPQDMIDEVWEGLDTGDGVAAVLDALGRAFGPATAALPPFAVALLQDDAVRTAVRGDLRLTVETLSGALEVTGGASDTWTVRLIEDALSVRVRPAQDAPASASELPIASGAVLAATVSAVFFETEEEDEPSRPRGDDARDSPVPDDLVNGLSGSEAQPPSETLLPEDTRLGSAAGSAPGPAATTADDLAVADTIVVHRDGAADPVPAAADEAPGVMGDTIEPLGDHDGATITFAEFAARGHVPLAAPEPVDARLPEVQPVAPGLEAHGDHDGATISVHELGHSDTASVPRDAAVWPAPPTDEVPFEGTERPEAQRLDPAPLPRFDDVPSLAASPFAPGPSRGRVRLSTGEVVELDRPVIIGRRPRSARTTGADMPHLVAVESPQNDISRNHVEISSDGETVVVTDLHTTNGTVLYRTGLLGGSADPVRLHPGEQTVVVAGDVVDIGDGVTLSFEDLP